MSEWVGSPTVALEGGLYGKAQRAVVMEPIDSCHPGKRAWAASQCPWLKRPRFCSIERGRDSHRNYRQHSERHSRLQKQRTQTRGVPYLLFVFLH